MKEKVNKDGRDISDRARKELIDVNIGIVPASIKVPAKIMEPKKVTDMVGPFLKGDSNSF